MKKAFHILSAVVCCLLFAACSATKGLKPGENLYWGAKVTINPDSSKRIKNEKEVRKALEAKTRPRPNKRILGIPFKLLIYNLAGEPTKNKGIRYWMRNKVGEPPVLASELKLKLNTDVLSSYLISQGYLQAFVTGDTLTKNRKTTAYYTAHTGARYVINRITFPTDSSGINAIIQENKEKSLLKVGDYYDLDVYKNERIRIDNDLKEKGYFYFNPDYLIIQADSTIGQNRVNLWVKVKPIAPLAALKPFTINKITVFPNYTLHRDSLIKRTPPVEYGDLTIIDSRKTFKPEVFKRLIFFNKGEYYNRTDHNLSLNRLVNVSMFKYVKADFVPLDSFRNNQLNLNIYLTPLKRNSLSLQATVTNKSNNFVGSELRINQLFRNVFRGAEQLNVSVSGGFETQVGGNTEKNLNSVSLTAEGKLSFPRFLVPFFKVNSTSAFIPKTNISLSYQTIKKGSFYLLNSFKTEFGYNWKENIFKEHVFNPLSVTYVLPPDTSKAIYKENIVKYPALVTNLQKVFIIGSNYTFTYNNQLDDKRRNNIFFSGNAETAGNIMGLFTKKAANGEVQLFNTPISQFFRVEADVRDYFKVNKQMTWASRLFAGYGYAYGNSTSLPFVRQFFAGGSNDIRAFAARTLGPGKYQAPANQLFADQGGDIKLMMNSELRFKIVSILHGAVFADAGNIWTRKDDPLRPGSGFSGSGFLDEIAVGTGAGLRVDAKIFVVRLDLAFPLRKPYLPEGQRWVINDIHFGSKFWRRDNLVLNIGIGYPF